MNTALQPKLLVVCDGSGATFFQCGHPYRSTHSLMTLPNSLQVTPAQPWQAVVPSTQLLFSESALVRPSLNSRRASTSWAGVDERGPSPVPGTEGTGEGAVMGGEAGAEPAGLAGAGEGAAAAAGLVLIGEVGRSGMAGRTLGLGSGIGGSAMMLGCGLGATAAGTGEGTGCGSTGAG